MVRNQVALPLTTASQSHVRIFQVMNAMKGGLKAAGGANLLAAAAATQAADGGAAAEAIPEQKESGTA